MTEWDLDHPSMKSTSAHEPPAVLRMLNSGFDKQTILRTIKVRGLQLLQQIEESKVVLDEAASKGRPIHDALIPKEKT